MLEEKQNLLQEADKETLREYKLSLWWVRHRGGIKRLGLGLFMAFDAVLLLFVIWTFLDTYALSYDRELNQIARVTFEGQADLRSYTDSNAARDIVVKDERVFALGDGRFDFFAMLTNENDDWWVEFDYAFSYGDETTTESHAVFLPRTHKPVTNLSVLTNGSVRSAKLILQNVEWHRIDHHKIGDYGKWFEERSNIIIDDIQFRREPVGDSTIGVTDFTVTNSTAFGFFDPVFFVLLKQGSSVVGVSQVSLSSLDSLETRNVSLNWFGTIPGVSTVEVIVDINFFDPSVYKVSDGERQVDVRTR